MRDVFRASRILASKKPMSSILVSLLYQVRTYFQNKWSATTRSAPSREAKIFSPPIQL